MGVGVQLKKKKRKRKNVGVPEPLESIQAEDVKRYHIHFPPFIRTTGIKDNK